jgi:hypothetical protein
VVRATGLDITVYASDGKRSPGHLSRQGPEVLRWALFEAAKAAARPRSPDSPSYTQLKAGQGGNRATLAVAGKLVRRVRHTLLGLGDAALARSTGSPWRYPGGLTRGWCGPAPRQAAVPRPAPAEPLPPRPVRGRPQKTARPRTPGDTPSIILSPDPDGSAHPDKAGRRHARAGPITAARG